MRAVQWLRSGRWFRRYALGLEIHPLDLGLRIGLFPRFPGMMATVGLQVLIFSVMIGRVSNREWDKMRSGSYIGDAVRGQVRRDKAKRKRVRRGAHQ